MPGVRRGQGSTTFIDRALQTNRRRAALTDTPQPTAGEGVAAPSPQTQQLGSTPQRPVNAPQGAEREALLRTPARPAGSASPLSAAPSPEPRLRSIARVDEEFPPQDLAEASATGTNVAATNLGERFYRRYGRYPTDVDMSILAARKQFETTKGRPPSRDELLTYLRQLTVNRNDEFLY